MQIRLKSMRVVFTVALLLWSGTGPLLANVDKCGDLVRAIRALPQTAILQIPDNRILEPLRPHMDSGAVAFDLQMNPHVRRLVETQKYLVVTARGKVISNALHEIGILREEEFREVKEGSGNSIDLDLFDQFYDHIIVYDKEAKLIVGAYRQARLLEALRFGGSPPFYSSTLFTFDKNYIERKAPHTIELGRAIVRKEYQGTEVFMLLWKGIAQYILNSDPDYYLLEGSVSISNAYSDLAKQIMLLYLKKKQNMELAKYLIPNVAPDFKIVDEEELKPLVESISDFSELSEIIKALDGKPAPQLLSHYDGLGAEILNFNLDRQFGNSIDVYVSIDLRKTPSTFVRRFFGPAGVKRFKSQP